MTEFIRVEHEGSVSVVTIDRPDKLNALDARVLGELFDTASALRSRTETRAMIVTGSGAKAFVAGADIAAMLEMSAAEGADMARAGHRAFDAIEALPYPVIAAVNGFALGGGCELALACDFIYASENAKFGLPEVKLGIIPGFGGTQRLPRRVGAARAAELVFTGGMIDAAEALRLGLVNKVVTADELLEAARSVARTIATNGPLAVAEAKRVMREGAGRPLGEANAREIEGFGRCFGTHDQREGMSAFLARRAASFKGE